MLFRIYFNFIALRFCQTIRNSNGSISVIQIFIDFRCFRIDKLEIIVLLKALKIIDLTRFKSYLQTRSRK